MAIINGIDAEVLDTFTQQELLEEEKYNDTWMFYKRKWSSYKNVEVKSSAVVGFNSPYNLFNTMDELLKKAQKRFNDEDCKFVIVGSRDVMSDDPLLYMYIGKKDFSEYSIEYISDLCRKIVTFQRENSYLIDKVNNHIFISILSEW